MSSENIENIKEVLNQLKEHYKENAKTMDGKLYRFYGYLGTYQKRVKNGEEATDINGAVQQFVAANDCIINELQTNLSYIRQKLHTLKKTNEDIINSIPSSYTVTTRSVKGRGVKRKREESEHTNSKETNDTGVQSSYTPLPDLFHGK